MNERLEQLTELASELSPKHLKFANGIIKGKSATQAYIDAGYAEASAVSKASRLVTNGKIQKYIELSKQEAQEVALEETTFSEIDWIKNQNLILAMSLGLEKIQKYESGLDGSEEVEVKETNLAAANKAQELIARRMSWLTDNKKVQTEPISFHIDLG